MTRGPVAVLGGYGGVGAVAARLLSEWGVGPLRLGGRDPDRLARAAEELGGGVSTALVDATDPGALHRFCSGAAVVLNAAGPSHLLRDVVGRAARAVGAAYVDPAGDEDLRERLRDDDNGTVTLLSAGMLPGLTGLLPRCLAALQPGEGGTLTGYVGGRDRFTPAGASDYLLAGDGFGEPFAAVRAGVRVRGAARAVDDAWPPFFPEPVAATPYLSTESERVAAELKLADLTWFHVVAGRYLPDVLRRAASRVAVDAATAVTEVRRAADLDTFGREAYQIILVELSGPGGGPCLSVMLRGTGASGLTGAFAAIATRAAWSGEAPAGVHHAAEVLDPAAALDLLRTTPTVTGLEIVDGPADATEEETL
ncbi:saccharopine dehydrogenase NADP-binding domain-containing protein [Luedemannella helvata]|uniref:Saccharopine dehydrogenase NADP binding domain-containing protein n=1 Tax=Luedemannella helvata TaxID=349315 RepID=A0ABP4WZJ3_9ACTN